MNWILITIIGLVLLIIFIKVKEMRHHFFYKILGVAFVLFVLSAVYIFIKSDLNISTYEGFLSFGKLYYNWLGSWFGNARGITGYAVQQNWGLNSTIVP